MGKFYLFVAVVVVAVLFVYLLRDWLDSRRGKMWARSLVRVKPRRYGCAVPLVLVLGRGSR